MKKEIAGFVRNAIMNTAINNEDWGIRFRENLPFNDCPVFCVSTSSSRDEGHLPGYQLHTFQAIADAMGCSFYIDHDPELDIMEMYLS